MLANLCETNLSYCPISLLPMETKMIVKILVNRLKKAHVQVFILTKPCFETVIPEKSYMDFFLLLSCSFAA